MKQIVAPALVACSLLATLLAAQNSDSEGGSSLMQRGAEMFWKGLRDEMAPSLLELEELMSKIGPSMQGFLTEMGPALAEIAEKVEDWSRYEAPEILPNGDIIIRRKPDAPESVPSDQAEDRATDI
jgi:hypothetical protein